MYEANNFIKKFKKSGINISDEMAEYSYPGQEPKLNGLAPTDELLSMEVMTILKKIYSYPSQCVYEYKGVKSVVLYHGIDTMTIEKSIFELDAVLKFVSEYISIEESDAKKRVERNAFEENYKKNFPVKPVNSVEYTTNKELAIFRKNIGYYYNRLNNLLTENVIKIIGNSSPSGWINLGKRVNTSEIIPINKMIDTLKYIEEVGIYKTENKWQH